MFRRRQERDSPTCSILRGHFGPGAAPVPRAGRSQFAAAQSTGSSGGRAVPRAGAEAGGAEVGVSTVAALVWGGCPGHVGKYPQGFAGRFGATREMCRWGKKISGDTVLPYSFCMPSACAGEAGQPSSPPTGSWLLEPQQRHLGFKSFSAQFSCICYTVWIKSPHL